MAISVLYARTPRWAALVAGSEQLLGRDDFHEIKNIARNRAGFIEWEGQALFVKRFATRSWLRGLGERLKGSSAARSVAAAGMLNGAGFLAPAPLAAAEDRQRSAIRTSYLLSEALTGAQVFYAFLDRNLGGARRELGWRRAILAQVAREVRRLHDAGLFPSDLQETNLMLEGGEGPAPLRIYFVDLDRFRRLSRVSWRRRRRNLVQLDRSIGRYLSRSERLHFLLSYLDRRPAGQALPKLVSRLATERRRKDRQVERRRGGALAGPRGPQLTDPA